ncbi:AAA family ATPase [Actinomyces faecalis]|uniref:AAA family ATPase n=1 Tax=Actinomyces faecalis TaxID=2722820 RepID=UPI0015551681|nr:AAA family ATPase [Actinomyces faecalis]
MATIEELIAAKRAKGGPAVDPQVIASMPPVAGGGTRYTLAALNEEAAAVAAAPEGTRNDTLNMAAFRLGRYVGSGQLDGQTVADALTQAALAAGLGEAEIASTLRSGGLAGAARPKDVPEPWEPTQPPPTTVITPGVATTTTAQAEAETGTGTGAAGSDSGAGQERPSKEEQYARWRAGQVALQAEQLRISAEARDVVTLEKDQAAWSFPHHLPTLADELALPDEDTEYLIQDVLPVDANVLLTAQYKTGKTTMVLNLLRALADRTPFLGSLAVNLDPGTRVTYLNYEVGEGMIRRWFRAQGLAHPENVSLLNVRGHSLPVLRPHPRHQLVTYLKGTGARVLVVDPYARAFVGSGTDENDNMQAGAFLDAWDQIKEEAGIREMVMVTHTGRATDPSGRTRARGATRVDDWADVRWALTRDPERDTDRYLSASGRDVEWPDHLLTYDPLTRHLTATDGDRAQARRNRVEDAVVDVVLHNPGITSKALQAMVRERVESASQDVILGAVADARAHLRISVQAGPRGAKTYWANR